MFSVGDKVVYTHHGAGIVRKVEQITVDTQAREYLEIEILQTGMTALVPADTGTGLRPVSSEGDLAHVMEILRGPGQDLPSRWNQRFKRNQETLKSGDVRDIAQVVRNLQLQEQLSPAERQMLEGARRALVGEIMLARDLTEEEAGALVDQAA